MSLPAYFFTSPTGEHLDEQMLERLRADYCQALPPTEYGRIREQYGSVHDYDPVLRAHCRLNPEPIK